MSKTTVPVEGDVAREISQLAKSQGFSISRLVTDSLKLSTEMLRRGITPTRALLMYRLFEKIMAFDVVPVPLTFLEYISAKWNICEDKEVENYLRDVGRKFGSIVAPEFRSFSEFLAVVSSFFSTLPVARLEFGKNGDTWRIVFTAPGGRSPKCLIYFAEEALKSFGCNVSVQHVGEVITAEVTCQNL